MNKLRKIFVVSVMMITVLSLSMVTAPNVKAAAKAGDLIKMDGLSSVYYLGADGKRYVFPNTSTYMSWYKDFSGVVTVSQSELEGYPLGANVTVRPGTKLVKITTNPTVYAVEPGGNLRSIVSEANAIALFGADWAKKVIDVPDAFFTNYKTGTALTAGQYPTGQLVKSTSGADVYYFDGSNYRVFGSEASFLANGFDFADVVTTSNTVTAGGSAVAGAESALVDLTSGAGGTAGAGTGLTVSLAGTTPASGTIIDGTAATSLAAFNLTAANDGAVKVTTIKVKRTGITADSTLSAVYLYDGAVRLTDSATVSTGYATFTNASGIVTIPAGTTKTITVKSNIADSTSGQTVGVAINAAADVVTDGASVSGSFPVSGNTMSIASASLGTLAISTATPSSDATPEVQNDFVMWQNTATIGTTALNLKSIRFRQIGSATASDLNNFKLFVDGVQVGSTVSSVDANGYVNFDLSASPKKLELGARALKVTGDIVDGSTRTVSLSLRATADVEASDTEYGANVLATGTFPSTATANTIASGSLTVTRTADSPSGNVIDGATNITLAKYTLTAYGEPVKIETVNANATTSLAAIHSLRNGQIVINGVVYATAALTTLAAGTEYTVNYTVTPGTSATLELRADAVDADGTDDVASGVTITGNLVLGVDNAQGTKSLSLIDVPSAAKPGNQLTIATGSLSLAKTGTYGNQSVVLPQNAYKLGSFVLTGNSTEDINLTSIGVSFTASGTFANSNLTDVYVKYGNTTGSVKSTIGTGTSTWALSSTLAKNANLTLEVYANISSTPTSTNSIRPDMQVYGTTASSNTSVETSLTTGQVIQSAAGSLATVLDASAPASKQVVGNSTVDTAAFKFTASNDSYTITEVVATTTDATNIVSASLKDGSTVLATVPYSGTTATFSGLNVAVAANSSKILTVSYALGTVGTGSGSTGANIKTTLSTYKVNNSQGVQYDQTDESSFTPRAGNAIYVFKTKPTISNVALPSSTLSAGTKTLARVSVAADAQGSVSWKVIEFSVNKTANPTIASTTYELWDDASGEITAVTLTTTGDNLAATSAGSATIRFVVTSEQTIAAGTSKTYSLKATIGGSLVAGQSVYANVANPTTSNTASAAYAAGTIATKSFAWSDMSVAGHSETTADWNDDYLVSGLATDSQTLSL